MSDESQRDAPDPPAGGAAPATRSEPAQGLPSIVPRAPEDGLEGALDALRPSLPPPAAGAEVALQDDAEPEPAQPGEVPAAPESVRPGLLSAVLSRPPVEHDPGAQTAYRSIPHRASPELYAALAERALQPERDRGALLEHFAQQRQGRPRARLLTAAAEQWQRAGEHAHAAGLYEYAHQTDPGDMVALRELRKQALAERDLDRALELLQRELTLGLTQKERALALLLLAEIQRGHLGDVQAAERSAQESFQLQPSASAGLLLWELRAAAGRHRQVAQTLRELAAAWPEDESRAALLLELARSLLRAGEPGQAQALFEQAQRAHPEMLDAALGWYRAARAGGDLAGALGALERLEPELGGAGVGEDLLRARARALETTRGGNADALRLLAHAAGQPSLRLRARLAERSGDRAEQRAALQACKALSAGSERALALLGLAELDASELDFAAAAAALREASLADGRLALVRVVQATLARLSGDAASFAPEAETAELGDKLEAAARIARDARESERELSLLLGARGDSRTAALLALDAALELGRWPEAIAALEHEAQQTPPAARLGLQLALADLRASHAAGDAGAAQAENGGGLLPALQRVHAGGPPEALAALWLEVAAGLRGEAAACAATLAGDYLQGRPGAREAYERALAAAPGYAPACWALERMLQAKEERAALARVHAALANATEDGQERGARQMRVAALREPDEPQQAASLRRAAARGSAADALLCERGRAGDELATLALAELLEDAGHSAAGRLGGLCKLRAAALYEDADEPARAAVLYREVLDRSRGQDPHANLGLDRTLARAGLLGLLFDRLERLATEGAQGARIAALEWLSLMRSATGDQRHALGGLQALLELDPDHVGALRALERRAMEQGDLERLEQIAERLAQRPHDARERAGQSRLRARAHVLHGKSIGSLALDPALGLFAGIEAERGARAAGDADKIASAVLALCAHIDEPDARASYAMRAAEALERSSSSRAIAALAVYANAAPSHGLAHELLGRLRQTAGEPRAAAAEYERAARTAPAPLRAARLWYRAAVLWQDVVGDDAHARSALDSVVAVDVLHRDAFARLHALLSASGEDAALAALLQARIAAGGEPRRLTELHVERSRLLLRLGQREPAAASLKAALRLDPRRLDALRTVADLHLANAEHREAAEALIRFARLSRDPAALLDAFMLLGRIYSELAPDLRRAEIAYARAVGLDPANVEAIERLMGVYKRQREHDKALRACERLRQLSRDEDELDRRTVELADLLEDKRELLRAERALNDRREQRPASAPIIAALADLYARQHDQAALAVHLDRSIHALRAGLLEQPNDAARWNTLCDVLARRGRIHAAECVAALAKNLGLADARSEKLGAAYQPLHGEAFQAAFADRLWPETLTPAWRELLRWLGSRAGELLEREALGERLEPRPAALQDGLQVAAAQLKLPGNLALVALEGPRCLPLRDKPPTLGLGAELLSACDPSELGFLLLRALCTIRLGLCGAASADPGQLAALLELVQPSSPDPPPAALLQRLEQGLSPRQRRELQGLVEAATASGPLEAAALPALALQAGAQLALAALGNLSAALWALGACGAEAAASDYEEHVALSAVERSAEALSLLRFALSDAYLELHSEIAPGAGS